MKEESVKTEFPTEESVDKKTRVILPEYHVTWTWNNVKSIHVTYIRAN